jgi:RNA polymerase sigma-70 factor (ECF subfamily)
VSTMIAGPTQSANDATTHLVELRTLHETYGSRAQALAYRITRDHEIAADAVQEALLAAWRTRDSYDPDRGALSTWFLTIVHRRAVDQVRRGASRLRAYEGLQDALTLPTQADGPEERAVRADHGRRIRAAINRLPLVQRQTLTLAYYGGYTQSQIAGMLEIPLGTVKTRTCGAIRRLRISVERDDA